jgi:hypothetical protein
MQQTLKYDFLVTYLNGARALGYFYGALVSLYKDSSVNEYPRLTVQLWGLHGSGFSHIEGPFLAS